MAAQQHVFSTSLGSLGLSGVQPSDITFIAATLESSAPARRHLLVQHAAAAANYRRALADTPSAAAAQVVNVTYHIATANTTVTKTVATQLYLATVQGQLAVSDRLADFPLNPKPQTLS